MSSALTPADEAMLERLRGSFTVEREPADERASTARFVVHSISGRWGLALSLVGPQAQLTRMDPTKPGAIVMPGSGLWPADRELMDAILAAGRELVDAPLD